MDEIEKEADLFECLDLNHLVQIQIQNLLSDSRSSCSGSGSSCSNFHSESEESESD